MRVRIVVYETAPVQRPRFISTDPREVAGPRRPTPTSRDPYKGVLVTCRLMLAAARKKRRSPRSLARNERRGRAE